jgi:hypothetical protein
MIRKSENRFSEKIMLKLNFEEIVAMVDDSPEDIERSDLERSDLNRAKRAPPTIDLEASEVSGETRMGPDAEPKHASWWPSRSAISAGLIAAFFGAGAAALVISVAWFQREPNEAAAPRTDQAAIEALTSRVAGIEAKVTKPPATAPDTAAAARIEALEKSLGSLRDELAGLRAQSRNLEVAVDEFKSPAPDLAYLNERLAGIERATRAQGAEVAQESAKPADDLPLRRVVVASLLDVSVRQGDPYAAALPAAKSLAANPDALKPLDGFSASGVPHAAVLSRELLALVPKLSPPPQENTTGLSIIDRLQAGASRLVRIERASPDGNDRGAVIARVTAAALRTDIAEARRELNTLAPTERAAVQSWIDKADARDAALAASRQFATEAMTALASSRSD